MKRRGFLKGSITAAIAGSFAAGSNLASAADARDAEGREYYELRAYRLADASQHDALDQFLKQAAIPALNRAGAKTVGVFTEIEPKENPSLFVLIPYPSLNAFAGGVALFRENEELRKALTILPSFGQYSARRLTRRIAPQTRPAPAPSQPTPAPVPAPVPVQPAPQPVYRAAPAAVAPSTPVDPAKVAAQKSKSERDLLEWQKKRAEAGSDNAQYELGVRYLTGNGVDKDEKVGMEWLTKAAKSGNFQAKKKLEELKNEAGESKLGLPVPTVKSTPDPSTDKAIPSPAK